MSSFLRFLLPSGLLLMLAVSSTLHAATDAPMFAGTTLTLHGETYTWSSATEANDFHNDIYTTAGGQSVTVTGYMWGQGQIGLATVNGTSAAGTVNGHIIGTRHGFPHGTYRDQSQVSDTTGTFQINAVPNVTFTRHVNARSWQVNFGDDFLTEYGNETYSGPDGAYQSQWTYDLNYAEDSWTFTGGQAPNSGISSLQVFGSTYTFESASRFANNWYDASNSGWTDKYKDLSSGATLNITSASAYGNTGYNVEVWDPNAGTVRSNTLTSVPSSSLAGVTWGLRSAPTFAKAQLWLDGKLLNWQSGTIITDGRITDSYSGAGVTLTVSALTNDYFVLGNSAAVTITSAGGGTGTLAHDGTFTLSGHVLQNASPNRSAPLFTGTKTVIRVMGSDLAFTGGYQDSLGNRTDVYVSPSMGKLSMHGNAASPNTATVKLLYYSTVKSGTFSNGSFNIPNMGWVGPINNQPSVYGPPAFWVRGEFYTRSATTPTSYQSTAGHSLSLTGSSSWTLSGTDAIGPFSGACSKNPVGVFLVQDTQTGTSVPVLPANEDGTLHLSWEAPPTGMPPAAKVNNGGVWVFLGTSAEDTNPATSAAYYGSATASDASDWLLKLRTDGSSVVTCTDYGTAGSTTGSYSTQTHLFQTSGPESLFPVPVYGVDPNANNALWGLTPPQGGLPSTFIVRGEAWRLAAYDEPTDTFTYEGFYSGQEMTLGAADASGQRLVALADPVHNNGSTATTQGTLSSERRSVRLRDGTLALSGNEQGAQVAVQHEDDYQLHTIPADLDLVGNNFSFGILQGDASLAGALFQFADDSATATLHSILSRPQAAWGWWKSAGTDGSALSPVMWLGADHRLSLFKEANDAAPAIVLDPAGTSSFQGPVRVPQSGDIPMGIYQEGDPP
ncbi:hypothetical protein [Prosthecobacter sp.]